MSQMQHFIRFGWLVYDGVESSVKARDDCLLIQQQNGGRPVAITRRVVMC